MKLARVIGTLVSTRKSESIKGEKMLIIQPLNDKLEPYDRPIVAIDTVKAGVGELVYYTMAREACYAINEHFSPVDAAITGIVDNLYIEKTNYVNKEIFEVF